MSTSEILYYLKDGKISKIIAGTLQTVEDMHKIKTDERHSIIIDDEYFFYIHMQHVNVSGKKLNNIISNYLASKLPIDVVKKSNHININGRTLIYLISDELEKIVKSCPQLFSSAQKVSSPFIEFLSKYQDFIFKDSKRLYKVTEDDIIVTLDETLDFIDAKELLTDIEKVNVSMRLLNVKQRSKISNYPFIIPLAVLIICYVIFVIANTLSIRTLEKNERAYENLLQGIYIAAGLKDAKDPYGMLLLKAKRGSGGFDGMKILPILKELNDMKGEDIKLKSFNYRDKSIKIDGTANDFAKLESFQKKVETTVGQDINLGDTKKSADGVVFSMRYNR